MRAARAAAVAALLALGVAPGSAAPPLPRLGPAFNFALTTQQNDRLWLTQLRDRLVVMTFTCTTCQSCPGLMPTLADLSRRIGGAAGRRAFFVAVSVDPVRDTPLVLRRYLHEAGLDPVAWILLTGKPVEVDVVAGRYGVAVERRGGAVTHECRVVLIDGAGVVRGSYDARTLGRLLADLDVLLAEPPGS
jgi:cytochrome oxidase Cu insertion factor (SCO1/SenC/PrrC family)